MRKQSILLVILALFLLVVPASATPPTPVTPGPQPEQADYVVNTFIAKHVSIDGNVRLLQYADLWLMNRTAGIVQHATIDSGHGNVRMNMIVGDDYWWVILPLEEYGNMGRCRVVIRNAGQMIPTEVPVTTTVTFFDVCDALGRE